MFCSKCGAPNSEGARFCEKCGNVLAGAAASGGNVAAAAAPAPGMAQSPQPGARTYAVGKSPLGAVLLSFLIPGVGQFYCGEVKKGAIMLGIYLLSWATALIVIGWAGLLGVWIWSMVDAYNIASGKTPLSQ